MFFVLLPDLTKVDEEMTFRVVMSGPVHAALLRLGLDPDSPDCCGLLMGSTRTYRGHTTISDAQEDGTAEDSTDFVVTGVCQPTSGQQLRGILQQQVGHPSFLGFVEFRHTLPGTQSQAGAGGGGTFVNGGIPISIGGAGGAVGGFPMNMFLLQ